MKRELTPQVSLVLGKNLAPEQLDIINRTRKLEFNSRSEINPQPDTDDWDKPYFLVRHAQDFVAFGRLHTIPVELEGTRATILGIATIAAVQKGRGYGKVLMRGVLDYIEESGQTAVGFCNPDVSGFYEKCGYSILEKGAERFTHIDPDGGIIPARYPDDDVLYVNGEDHLIDLLKQDLERQILAFRASW